MARFKSQLLKKSIALILLAVLVFVEAGPIFGQAAAVPPTDYVVAKQQPPMRNVFFNVLWGSVCGGMVIMGWATLDDSEEDAERYSFSNLTTKFLEGATYGGLAGLVAGVYFSIQGVSFDEDLSRIAILTPQPVNVNNSQHFSSIRLKPDKGAVNVVNFQIRF